MTNRLGPKFNIHYIVSANVNGAFLLKKIAIDIQHWTWINSSQFDPTADSFIRRSYTRHHGDTSNSLHLLSFMLMFKGWKELQNKHVSRLLTDFGGEPNNRWQQCWKFLQPSAVGNQLRRFPIRTKKFPFGGWKKAAESFRRCGIIYGRTFKSGESKWKSRREISRKNFLICRKAFELTFEYLPANISSWTIVGAFPALPAEKNWNICSLFPHDTQWLPRNEKGFQ